MENLDIRQEEVDEEKLITCDMHGRAVLNPHLAGVLVNEDFVRKSYHDNEVEDAEVIEDNPTSEREKLVELYSQFTYRTVTKKIIEKSSRSHRSTELSNSDAYRISAESYWEGLNVVRKMIGESANISDTINKIDSLMKIVKPIYI